MLLDIARKHSINGITITTIMIAIIIIITNNVTTIALVVLIELLGGGVVLPHLDADLEGLSCFLGSIN